MGCGLWVLGFLVLAVVSFLVGSMLRPDPGSSEVTLSSGGSGTAAYVLVGSIDELDDPCVQMYRPGEEGEEGAEITGQCGVVGAEEGEARRYRITSTELDDGTTVAFGPVPRPAVSVRLTLADGSRRTVATRQADGIDLQWFSVELDQPVEGPAEVLDGNGDVLIPPPPS
jgi:hypothetical protein